MSQVLLSTSKTRPQRRNCFWRFILKLLVVLIVGGCFVCLHGKQSSFFSSVVQYYYEAAVVIEARSVWNFLTIGSHRGGGSSSSSHNDKIATGTGINPTMVLPIRFHFSLSTSQEQKKNIEWLEKRLYEISDPENKDYGKWMTIGELGIYISPSEEILNDFLHWLHKVSPTTKATRRRQQIYDNNNYHDIESYEISPSKDSIVVYWSVETIERVFSTKMVPLSTSRFGITTPTSSDRDIGDSSSNSGTGRKRSHSIHSISKIMIPKEIESIVDFITGVDDNHWQWKKKNAFDDVYDSFLSRHTRLQKSTILGESSATSDESIMFEENAVRDEGRIVTPQVIYETYNCNISSGLPTNYTAILSKQSIAEFEEAYFYPSDLIEFEKKYKLPIQNVTKIIGPNIPEEGYLGEASLDIQYIVASAPTVPTYVFSQYSYDIVEWAESIIKYDNSNDNNGPKVHSFSWGSPESHYDHQWLLRSNFALMKLSLLGHTVIVASGDDGAGNDGHLFFCKHFDPNFPGTSPFVTSVGGTYLDISTDEEIGWTSSGGGFSNVFPRPKYQKNNGDIIQNYLDQLKSNDLLPPNKLYNSSTTRATPDVSALSTNYQLIIENYTGTLSGTSAATPTFAGFVSRLNQVRLENNKPVLGFINPLLYTLHQKQQQQQKDKFYITTSDSKNNTTNMNETSSNDKQYECFNDITKGNNKPKHCQYGWSAQIGWDAITGLGTPNVANLLKEIRAL